MTSPALRSATALLTALRTGELTSRALLETYLDRIARLDGRLNAVVTLDADTARQAADDADTARARGAALGPLHGLPVTIKDSHETAALRTTSGFSGLADHVPTTDADAVARLKAAGAIVFAKTNLPVLAGDAQSYNPLFGVTNNPWAVDRSPGGSSGGAAVAVAMGFTAFELGSDIGGSIRTPCHWCGIYGHKPTHGIVSTRGHIPAMPGTLQSFDLEVSGPMARSAEDLALVLDVLAGPTADRAVAWTLRLPPPRRTRLQDYRVAAWLDDPAFPVDDSVRTVLEATVVALRRAGCRVDDARPAVDFAGLTQTYFQLLMPILMSNYPDDAFAGFIEMATAVPADDHSFFATSVRFGTARHRDWLRANEARAHLRMQLAEFFTRYDALLLPAASVPAIPHDHSEPLAAREIMVNGAATPYSHLFAWIALATMAWNPATVAPVGRTATGLPVGVQIVGPYLEDYTTINVARQLAPLIGGFEAPPGA